MIDAAQPALLVASEEQRRAPVGAQLLEHPDPAVAVAERHQRLAQQLDAKRRAVGLELGRGRGRQPVAPHEVPHRRARPDPGNAFIVLARQHPRLPPRAVRPRAMIAGSAAYTTTGSDGTADRDSQPPGVTRTDCPSVIASPASLSAMIMCRKNTMSGAATTGLPAWNIGQSIQLG